MNLSKKLFPFLVILIILLLGTLVLTNRSQKNVSQIPQSKPIPPASYLKEYKTKFYNSSDIFFGQIKYEDIILTNEDSLISISCSENFEGTKNVNANVSLYPKMISEKHSESEVYAFMVCSSREGQTFVIYKLGPCGGGCYGRPYVGIAEENSIVKTVEIPNELYTYYYGCSAQPLQLTKNSELYISCGKAQGSLEGDLKANSVYKLNLDSFTISKIKACSNVNKGQIIPNYKCQ